MLKSVVFGDFSVADQVSPAVTLAASLPPLLMASKASEVQA